MTIRKLASDIAKREGKKTQARIGEIREVLAILSDMFFDSSTSELMLTLYKNGARRSRRKK